MKKYWLLGILVILMLACNALTSSLTTPTPAIVFPTFSTESTSTPLVVTPTIIAGHTEIEAFSAIIAGTPPGPFFLLGGTGNGEWLAPDTILPHMSQESYQIYDSDGLSGLANGETPVFDQICQLNQVDTDFGLLSELSVGVTGDWDVTPRLVQEISPYNATYIEALRTWLVDQNFSNPWVEISQILRVDLEGDGTDEVLISASHFSEPTGHNVRSGDYSLVLMRKIVGTSVATVPLVADYYYQVVENQFPLTYATTFPADLNNDGVLEVMVGVERWEGSGVMVYEINGTTISTVFEALCGL